jgi:hypothetical protein
VLPRRDPNGAIVDFRALAPERRFTDSKHRIDLNLWLDKGIDLWVWACVAAFKSLLFSGSVEVASLIVSGTGLTKFLQFLTADRQRPLVEAPADLRPLHIANFVAWLMSQVRSGEIGEGSARNYYMSAKRVLDELLEHGYVVGDRTRLFPRGLMKRPSTTSNRHPSFTESEQEHIAQAIKSDLSRAHRKALSLPQSELQGLRFMLVSHRQGANLTPLLELSRKGMTPGLIPGTVNITTAKHRGKTIRARMGRAAVARVATESAAESIMFALAEGAIIQQAIDTTEPLVALAPPALKDRVWLYASESSRYKQQQIHALTPQLLQWCIARVVTRHDLRADDGEPLRINASRFRKSFFDRAYRVTGGSIPFTANLMGNTPEVAASNYPSMNVQLQVEAANFLQDDYIERLRASPLGASNTRKVIQIAPVAESPDLAPTALSRCSDPVGGEFAPHNGTPCDLFVKCLFCSSFAIVGSELDLWKLFSFQSFAKSELAALDAVLGEGGTADPILENLRDMYRVAIPFITTFCDKQFASSTVQSARRRLDQGLHPFWALQSARSERVRKLRGG